MEIRFIDLFAGIGGMRIPFDEIGANCVFSSEWDQHAAAVYEDNFKEIPHGDISRIDESEIPEHDLLLAGFPCQPFSHAGHKKGFSDTRGTLFFDVARIVSARKPKVLLLENVRGLISHDNGGTFRRILEVIAELGYVAHWKVLNARDFGLPQNRPRVFIVGIRADLEGAFDYDFPPNEATATAVSNILESEYDENLTISDRLWEGHRRRKLGHSDRGNGFGYSLVSGDSETTRTLSARYYKDGSEILVMQKDSNPRKLSIREAANLQGFPTSFRPSTSSVQAYKQFGNSVAVPVIRAISRSLIRLLS
jgi:DNA (cytosine-5)-methyltransferase 1